MKKINAQKKLQLTKVKVAKLTTPKDSARVCLTSLAQTTCPFCHQTINCSLPC